MIIGFDHVALNVANFQEAACRLDEEGYERKFLASGLPNNPAKIPLLLAYRPDHGIAYYAKPDALPIELTCHGTEKGRKAGNIAYQGDLLILKVADTEKEADFWRSALGFKDNGQASLTFNAVVAQWRCKISLKESPDVAPALLDDEGYTCIALLVKDIDRDMQRVAEAGAQEQTEIFAHEMNGHKQRIAMFRTPGNIIVELVEINKG
jgi:hypothetical protein